MRFYCGVPLELQPGVAIGTICVLGLQPRAAWSAADAASLALLARQVVAQLRLGLAMGGLAATNALLQQAQAERDAAEERGAARKREFMAAVSHELRSPLAGVAGAAALLQASVPRASEAAELAALVADGAARMDSLLSDVLDYGSLGNGALRMAPAAFSVRNGLLRPVRRMLECAAAAAPPAQAAAKLRALRMSYDVAADVPPRLHGDASRLQQVATNLLTNVRACCIACLAACLLARTLTCRAHARFAPHQAIKFTPAGGRVSLRICLRRDASPAATSPLLLELAVADSGIGLAPAALQAVFIPFQQAEAGTRAQFGGTGLGLAVRRASSRVRIALRYAAACADARALRGTRRSARALPQRWAGG